MPGTRKSPPSARRGWWAREGRGFPPDESGPGAAVFSDPTDPLATVSNLVTGTYIFQWTITSGVCPPSIDTMTVRVASTAIVSAGPDDIMCETQPYTIMGATASNYVSLLWTTTGTGTFNDPTLLNPVYTPSLTDITAVSSGG